MFGKLTIIKNKRFRYFSAREKAYMTSFVTSHKWSSDIPEAYKSFYTPMNSITMFDNRRVFRDMLSIVLAQEQVFRWSTYRSHGIKKRWAMDDIIKIITSIHPNRINHATSLFRITR